VPPSDADLIESSWADPEAFAGIFDRHFPAVYRFCVRRVDLSTAEELAGETFLRAFSARRRYDLSHENDRPWLFGVARNVLREHFRRARREDTANRRSVATELPESFDPVVLADGAREDVRSIALALPTLPGDEVETLLLFVWDGLSYEECARALGVPIGTVRSRLSRVRRRLQEVLTQPSECPDLPLRRIDSSSTIRPLRDLGGSGERPL
jgi:RNA polymerase sigma factor (sigma-70 family)